MEALLGHFCNWSGVVDLLGLMPYVDGVNGTDLMDTEQFYRLWEKYAFSEMVDELPDDVEEFCAKLEITVDYYIEEFI